LPKTSNILSPTISVVTPSFNQGRFLEATMRSVLEQSYPKIEYIVVDGGSTDGSQEIIKQYANRLAWWVSEPDNGQTDAINKGFSRATGEIFAWLNSDDTYEPGAMAGAVAFLQKNPEVGMVYGDTNFIDAEGRVIGKFNAQQTSLGIQRPTDQLGSVAARWCVYSTTIGFLAGRFVGAGWTAGSIVLFCNGL